MEAAARVVVLVEDEDAVRQGLQSLLELKGMVVHAFGEAGPARDCLAELPAVDVLVTDLSLPGRTSGADLAMQARRARPDLGIVLVTGYLPHHIEGTQTLQAAGAQVLAKPFLLQDLLDAIAAAVAHG